MDETTLAPVMGSGPAPVTPVTPDLPGRFSVQLLEGSWFIGPMGAVQRIEDAQWLENWLVANGTSGYDVLDFAGDHELRQRFVAELAQGEQPAQAAPDRDSTEL